VLVRAQTEQFINALMPELELLESMVDSPNAINGVLSMDDVRILPLLRSLAVVRQLEFPAKVRAYFQSMMSQIGYKPLPSI
jgi:glutaredoxin 2